MPLDTLWGEFEETEELETPNTEKEEEGKLIDPPDGSEESNKDDDTEKSEKGEDTEKDKKEEPNSEGEGDKDKENKKEKPKEDDEDPSTMFDEIAASLEDEELLFLGEDKEYEATPEGFKQMMEDNMLAYKDKLEKDFQSREAEIRKSYEESNKPKIADMDPSNESQALEMLEQYYQETGFTEDEIQEKIEEVKELDNVEKEAKVAQRFLGKKEKEADEAAQAQQAKQEEARQKEIQEYVDSLKSDIDSKEEMAGFKLTNKVKKDFKDYLFKTDKDGKTPAQKAGKDPERRLRLAFLDFMDFNKKDFEIKAKTELANEYSKKVSRFTNKQSKGKGKPIEDKQENEEGLKPGFLDFWNTEN